MHLLVNVVKTKIRQKRRRILRCTRDFVLLSSGVLMTCASALTVSYFFTGSDGVVYAVGDAVEQGENRLQVGLKGIMDGVASMRTYSQAELSRDLEGAAEEILVGTKAASRSAINHIAFSGKIRKAGELGYQAQQTVISHQLPYDEYYTLLQIVEAEATGGDVLSKLLVANVVLNRVKDSHFPNTISEVVWERVDGSAQFSPTADGRISSCEITDSTVEAVDLALEGEDNSQGALFFVARDSASPGNVQWFDTALVRLFAYGGHEYYNFREYCE